MLIELVVRNLGVIDELSLVLGPGMTAVIHPGNRAKVDGFGNIEIHLDTSGSRT